MCSFMCSSLVSCLEHGSNKTENLSNLLVVLFYSGCIIDLNSIVTGEETGLFPQIVSYKVCYILLP
jgi:hypothetical protein